MRCNTVRSRLVAWQDRELAPGEHVLVSEHLERCPECRAVERRLALATPKPSIVVPEALAERAWTELDAAIAEEFASPRPAAPVWRWRDLLAVQVRVPLVAAAAYTVLLLAALGWGAHAAWSGRSIEATLAAVPTTASAIRVGRPATVIPADQYKAASWSPPREAVPAP
jgi:predicted anti-sigma-YlaC factor YlaD